VYDIKINFVVLNHFAMAHKKKEDVIETKEVEIVEVTMQDVDPIGEEPKTEMIVTNEEVKPIVVTTNKFIQGDKVQLVNGTNNKVIAMAVDRKYAEKLVAKNPNLKIVK